jgi:hypothetical protein
MKVDMVNNYSDKEEIAYNNTHNQYGELFEITQEEFFLESTDVL